MLWNDLVFFGCWIAACATLYSIFDNWGMFTSEKKEHEKAQRQIYWIRMNAAAQDKIYERREP